MSTPMEARPGIVAIRELPCGARIPVAECARCERDMPIRGRGLCYTCHHRCSLDGTLARYGYVKADRLADYGSLRPALPVARAAARIGVSLRTAWRYEATLRGLAA